MSTSTPCCPCPWNVLLLLLLPFPLARCSPHRLRHQCPLSCVFINGNRTADVHVQRADHPKLWDLHAAVHDRQQLGGQALLLTAQHEAAAPWEGEGGKLLGICGLLQTDQGVTAGSAEAECEWGSVMPCE